MASKRKDLDHGQSSQAKTKRIRQEKVGDFSDDEDLSDIEENEIFNGIRIPLELPPIVSAEENAGPRMVIKNIVANNFKSYYGEVDIGPFHKSLTSIVGANGSGKSNVIDSLLFVFGYRSTKIRSKKVSVLLHKSDKHKDVHQCSVTVNFVHIHDDDTQDLGFIAIPGSEITITRTAFKDNTSFYTLNNKRVKFKEIATILKKNGIDLIHNRFLILQGEVEQIAMMKPKAENEHSTGMLEYLEDIIGTVRYKKPIIKLEEKVKELSAEKTEKITRLKFVAKEREELLEPVENCIRFLKLENRKTWLMNKTYQFEMYKINKKLKTKTEKLTKIEEELTNIENEVAIIEESKKNKQETVDGFNEKLKDNTKKHTEHKKKHKKLSDQVFKVTNSLNNNVKEIKQYENSITQEKKKIAKAEDLPIVKEAELKKLQSQLVPLEEECSKLEANYTKINSSGFEKSKKFREEKDALAPEELKLQKLVGIKKNQLQTLNTEFEVLLDSEKSENEKLLKLEEDLSKGTNEFQENERSKENSETAILNCKSSIKDLERNIEELKINEEQIKTKLQTIRQSLTEKKTAYAETTGRSRPILYTLKLKDEGKISGILGRCGDYGQVEGKYDIPACTACGSTDQIVVETAEAAQACIKMLKENNVGRLTFSVLPQIQKLKPLADAKNNYPENSKRIFDYIQILDQRFRLTFYSGVYDTLLAEDLEQARRIAFGTQTRYRVVTYKGDLIDQSGIMSGGGRPNKGKIGPQETKSKLAGGNTHLVSQNDVEKLDKIIQDLEIKLRETQSKIFDLQLNVQNYHGQIDELNKVVRQCSSHINAWKEKEIQLKNLILTQKKIAIEKKTNPIVVANKKSDIKKAEEELNVAIEEYNVVKSKVDAIKKKIELITEGEPKEAKLLLDEATDKLDKTRCAINQINVNIQAAHRQVKISKNQIETLKDRINKAKNQEQTLKNQLIELNEKLAQSNELDEEMEEDLKKQRIHIEKLQKEIDDGNEKSTDLRMSKVNISKSLDDTKVEIERLVQELGSKKKALSNLKLHTIPKIDNNHRDPVTESYQNRELKDKSIKLNTLDVSVDEENSKNNDKSQKTDDTEKIHDDINQNDDDNDIDNKELPQYTDEQMESIDETALKNAKLSDTEKNIEKPNFNVLDEYDKRNKQYHEKANEVTEVLKLYNDHVDMTNKVKQRRRDEFMASFKKITIKLKEMYQMITLGGDAELELVDSLDPFSEGVNFSVRPPKKTWKVITNLSGGEKTLSSLALVFALHYYKPSPLYVMDEIDAALDFKNVSIIAYYIKERTKNSQFIIISLRSNMFEKANVLVGIYKTNDCTATTSITTSEYSNREKAYSK
ncbi:structural maintenance of chromosomes protein 4 isoform X2 [Sipha flava]|nr:structural maintenance of chromosomes protein 4 isoform X2 [Sipha flava]XP_025424027.1 structural maintenance of chromosomes protein 4 isoform X2 [Sipha flava]